MADTFTVEVIKASNKTDFKADCKAYLDTLTATNIDTIQVTQEAHALVMTVVSHA